MPSATAEGRLLATELVDRMFRNGRSIQRFRAATPPEDAIRLIEELTYLGPTSMNCQPLRIAWLHSSQARARAIGHLEAKNKPKSQTAPLMAVLSYDQDWHDKFPIFAPYMAERREQFADDGPRRARIANDNAHLQAGYFILAVRTTGLSVGPMSGFDPLGIAREFDLPESWHPFLIVNIGLPAIGEPQFPRLPRLDAAGVASVVL